MPTTLTNGSGQPLTEALLYDASGNPITSHSSALDVSIRSQAADVTIAQATAASLNARVTGAGSAGTADTGVVTVQGIASMTALLVTPTNTLTLKRKAIAASSSGDNQIVAAVSGKKITVYAFELSFSGTVNAKFTDGASGTNLGGLYYGVANSGAANAVKPEPNSYLFQGSTNTDLTLNLSAGVAVGGAVSYWEA